MYINEKKILNSSINTITTYLYVLDSFYEYITGLDSTIVLEDINKEVILSFLNKDGNFSINTKVLRLAVLKSFFIYVDEQEELKGLFELRFKKLTIKKEDKEVEALSESEVQRLLELFRKPSISFNKNRDALLIKLILFTGIRASECLNIRIQNLSLLEEEGVYKIKVLGKGNKERYVYITIDKIQRELNFLKDYISDYIAITNQGKAMSRIGLYSVISNKMKKALIHKKGVHILRHTFARNLVTKNINLSTISELLGHADITLTARTYAKSDEGSKIRAVLG
jgi:integrase/recombinase XerD